MPKVIARFSASMVILSPFLMDGDGAADEGFWRDVADHGAVAAAAEATVGDERDVFAEAFAHDGARGAEHLAHTGAALGFDAPRRRGPLDLVVEDGCSAVSSDSKTMALPSNLRPSLP